MASMINICIFEYFLIEAKKASTITNWLVLHVSSDGLVYVLEDQN